MSTQYNKIQKPYDELRKSTISIIERVNVREIVLPLIHDAKVLDLACGTGFYSRSFLKWGAKEVVGVDISSAMLEEAQALSGRDSAASFVEADCSEPVTYPGGPFDIVFAAWLLNYAPNGKNMVSMYHNILLNLKPSGHFVAVTPPPSNDPAAHIEREGQVRPLPTASGGLFSSLTGDVEDGVAFHRHSSTQAGDLDYDCFHLRRDVWEAAASEAGFESEIHWRVTKVPNDFMDCSDQYGEDENGGAGPKELATYADVPHFGLLTLKK